MESYWNSQKGLRVQPKQEGIEQKYKNEINVLLPD